MLNRRVQFAFEIVLNGNEVGFFEGTRKVSLRCAQTCFNIHGHVALTLRRSPLRLVVSNLKRNCGLMNRADKSM